MMVPMNDTRPIIPTTIKNDVNVITTLIFLPAKINSFSESQRINPFFLLMFQACHPCAGLSGGRDLWLRRVSQGFRCASPPA